MSVFVLDPVPTVPPRAHRTFAVPSAVPNERASGAAAPHPTAPVTWLALTRFEILAGLRAAARTADVLEDLGVADLARPVRVLRAATGPGATQAVASTAADLLAAAADPEVVARWAGAAATAARRLHAGAAGRRTSDSGSREVLRVLSLLGRGAEERPDDPSVVLPLVMNHLVVAPAGAVAVARRAQVLPLAGCALRVEDDAEVVDPARHGPGAGPLDLGEASAVEPVPLRAGRRDGTAVVRAPAGSHEIALLPPGATVRATAGTVHRLWTLDAAVSVATRRRVVVVPAGRSAHWEGEDAALRVMGPGTAVLVRPLAVAAPARVPVPTRPALAAVS